MDAITKLNRLQKQIAPTFMEPLEVLNETTIWPLTAHIFSACFCMGCSAIFHWFQVKDQATSSCLARLDYGGISILIFGTTVPISTYGMPCEAILTERTIFQIAMGLACMACFVVTIAPGFDKPKYRKWRGIMFIILGLSCALLFIAMEVWER